MLARRIPFYILRETVPLYVVGVVTILVLLLIDYFATLIGYFLSNRTPVSFVLVNVWDRIPFFCRT
ncbi:MAG: hypothetical protein HC933_10960 [Pleurocapsa sp. SU_196_0]|nr:hypothetical protein [Pleurocapsa sp. SU_196_0]